MATADPIDAENTAAVPTIDRLNRLVGADMEHVNQAILACTGSDVQLIPEVAAHLIDSGGKRLRPMLTLASARMFGYRGKGHVQLAASVEFMHTATLLHDDVVDESEMRRGKASARMVWGNEASVLVGDFLLGQAFKMMVAVGSLPALEVLADAAAVIAEGEVMQLASAGRLDTGEDTYLEVIGAKTAALFKAACEVGAIIGDGSDAERRALAGYGTDLGLAFQLVDDALDYSGSQAALGKRVGDDFRDGKVTLPVLLAYNRGDVRERAFWTRCLCDREIGEGDLEEALALMARRGALEDTVARARTYGLRARRALDALPGGEHRTALSEVVDFCVARSF